MVRRDGANPLDLLLIDADDFRPRGGNASQQGARDNDLVHGRAGAALLVGRLGKRRTSR